VPELREGPDRVEVTVRGRVLNPQVIAFMAKAEETFQLTQRERITLGLLAQHEALTAQELASRLELPGVEALSPWFGRLQRLGLVKSAGRTRAVHYFVDPALMRDLGFSGATTLKRIEPHRLRALLLEDLRHFPASAIGEIHGRTAPEIPRARVKRALDRLIREGNVVTRGEKRWRRYSLAE
jgi:ATP-dependent DNA helicase RecG